MDRDFWNDAYRENPTQVEVADFILDGELVGLPAGTALDLGCGAVAEVWGFVKDESPSPDQIVELLPGLVIERAEVRHLQDVFSTDDPRAQHGSWASVAFVRARRP